MVQVNQLAGGRSVTPQQLNQSTRWITTKEEHAANIINTVSTYFLTQKVGRRCRLGLSLLATRKLQRCRRLLLYWARAGQLPLTPGPGLPCLAQVKEVPKGDPAYQHYLETLALHHQVMRDAMKAKQSVDVAAADNLDHSISHLEAVYKAQ